MSCRKWLCAGLAGIGLWAGATGVGWRAEAVAQSPAVVAPAASDSVASLFSADSLAFVEIARPDQLTDEIAGHPVMQRALELDGIKQALRSPQYLAFRMGLGFVEGQLGATWPELVQKLAGGGIAAAVGNDGRTVVLVIRSSDEPLLRRALGTLLNFAVTQAKNAGGESPFRVEEDGDAKLAVFDGMTLARRGADVVVSNERSAVMRVIDRLRGQSGDDPGLAARPELLDAAGNADAIRAWVDLDRVRRLGLSRELFRGMADNPGTELVLGGVLEALQDSPWLTATLTLEERDLQLSLEAALDAGKVASSRQYFFGPDGQASAPALVDASQMLASVSAWRDLSGWWLSKEDLFDENTVAQLVQADAQISTLFQGLDFGGEVLGALEPGLQIVVDRQEFAADAQPDLQLPAFALVGQLRKPAEMGRRFKSAFQSTMGFVNLGLTEQGQPQFDVNTQTTATGCICSSQVFPEADAPKNLVVYNFSPTLVVAGDRLILSSTLGLAERLQEAGPGDAGNERPDSGGAGERVANTVIGIDLQAVTSLLDANREALIANNMMEKGHDHAAAESEIGVLLDVARLFRDLEIRLENGNGRLALVTRIGFQEPGAGQKKDE